MCISRSFPFFFLLLQCLVLVANAQRGGPWGFDRGAGNPETAPTITPTQDASAEQIASGSQAVTDGQAISKPYRSKFNSAWGDMFNVSIPQIAGYKNKDVPQACRDGDPEGSQTMYAADVWITDCGTPWTVCMADSRVITMEAAVRQLARVPVSLRRFLTTLDVLGLQGTSPVPASQFHRWMTGKTTFTCAGVCDQQSFVTNAAIAATRAMGWANSSAWRAAVDGDSCVATAYAQTAYEQAFAQPCLVNTFKHYNGFYPNFGPQFTENGASSNDWSCMSRQLAYLDQLPIFDKSFDGATCAIAGVSAPQDQPPPSSASKISPGGGYTKVVPAAGATPTLEGKSLTAPPSAAETATSTSSSTSQTPSPTTSTVQKEVEHAKSNWAEPSSSSTSTSGQESGSGNDPDWETSSADASPTATASEEPGMTMSSTASGATDNIYAAEPGLEASEPILRNFMLEGSASRIVHLYATCVWVALLSIAVALA